MMQSRPFIPVPWEQIPDLGLYMDQVLTYVHGALESLHSGENKEILTASMVNNYVKQGLIPRPQGKKYSREHLARLLMIAFLKRTMAMDDIKKLFAVMGADVCQTYTSFAACQTECVKAVQEDFNAQQVMHQAIHVATAHLKCLAELENLYEKTMPQAAEKKEKEKRERRKKQDD